MEDPVNGPNMEGGLSSYKIRRHLEDCLKRLQTDHIELYQMHHIDSSASWDELWEVFQSFIQQGSVDYIGSSNFAGWHLALAQAEAKARHIVELVSEQHKYSLFCREPELEVLPSALYHGIGGVVVAWSPLAGGLLGGNALKPKEGSRSANITAAVDKHRLQLECFAALCSDLGESESNVALAWVLSHPALTVPIIGPRTLKQFEDSLRAVEIVLDDNTLTRINEIFPGPDKPAPEAYAW